MTKPDFHQFDDIPGTTIFTIEKAREGFALNQFCMSLMKAQNRVRFKAGERAYLDEWPMTEEQRRSVLDREPIDLLPLLTRQVSLLHHSLPSSVELSLRVEPGDYRVLADPTRIQQMIMNLAVNARDAISEAGLIVMETRPVSVQTTIRNIHGDITPGDYVVFSVADTGSGMTPEVLEHIFEPFFTTKRAGYGVGLGLAVGADEQGLLRGARLVRGAAGRVSRRGAGLSDEPGRPRSHCAPEAQPSLGWSRVGCRGWVWEPSRGWSTAPP